jgi:SulP family sulfate permease
VCVAGVLAVGVYQGILFAIVVAFFQLIRRSSKPHEFEMIYDPATATVREFADDSPDTLDDEILIYRFGSALLFYNVDYFVEKISGRANAKKDLKRVVIDAMPINIVDLTAMGVLKDLIKDLNEKGIGVAFCGANEAVKTSLASEIEKNNLKVDFYPNVPAVFREA